VSLLVAAGCETEGGRGGAAGARSTVTGGTSAASNLIRTYIFGELMGTRTFQRGEMTMTNVRQPQKRRSEKSPNGKQRAKGADSTEASYGSHGKSGNRPTPEGHVSPYEPSGKVAAGGSRVWPRRRRRQEWSINGGWRRLRATPALEQREAGVSRSFREPAG
jgi:hypothetical protein